LSWFGLHLAYSIKPPVRTEKEASSEESEHNKTWMCVFLNLKEEGYMPSQIKRGFLLLVFFTQPRLPHSGSPKQGIGFRETRFKGERWSRHSTGAFGPSPLYFNASDQKTDPGNFQIAEAYLYIKGFQGLYLKRRSYRNHGGFGIALFGAKPRTPDLIR